MTKKNIQSALLLSTLLLMGSAQAATKSISTEVFKETGDTGFWQVEVVCDASSDIYLLNKKLNTQQWCVAISERSCFDTKLIAAQKVCSGGIVASVQASDVELATPDEDDEYLHNYEELRKEKVKLEDQRIQIQQEKLNLRRREVELQKRQLNYK